MVRTVAPVLVLRLRAVLLKPYIGQRELSTSDYSDERECTRAEETGEAGGGPIGNGRESCEPCCLCPFKKVCIKESAFRSNELKLSMLRLARVAMTQAM